MHARVALAEIQPMFLPVWRGGVSVCVGMCSCMRVCVGVRACMYVCVCACV